MKEVTSVAFKLFEGLGTSVSLGQYLLLKYGEFDQLVKRTVNPNDYENADAFRSDYIAVSFLKKTAGLPTSFNTRQAAVESFYASERACAETNVRISQFAQFGIPTDTPGFDGPLSFQITSILSNAQRDIQQILGECPSVSKLKPRFGPGATSANVGQFITIMDKLTSLPECTRDALWASRELNTYPAWSYLLSEVHPECVYKKVDVVDDFGDLRRVSTVIAPRLVRGNRFTTVPKTAVTDRGICIEPHLNSCFQSAVGRLISQALTRRGLHIPTAQIEHGKMARLSSLSGKLATVDLSAASDTISYELVKLLLPFDWFCLLASLRSPETWIDGKWVELEKFSSMGNGYTFELETLIFWALARAVADAMGMNSDLSSVRAYGDDLFVPTECVPLLKLVFSYCGFTVNASKTFDDSSQFRESCGQDFLYGHNVRPFFLKEVPNEVHQWFSLANGIRRLGVANPHDDIWDPRFLRAWLECLSNIPSRFRRLRGPKTLGDSVIHDQESVWRSEIRYRHGVGRLRSLYRAPVMRGLDRYCADTQYAVALYGGASDGQALRNQMECARIVYTCVAI